MNSDENVSMNVDPENIKHILVVDDEDRIRNVICRILKTTAHHVEQAVDGQDAFDCFTKNEFNLVIVDLRMPNMDGESLMREIIRINQHTSFIVMTGHGDLQEAYTLLKEFRIADFIQKPLNNPSQLIFSVENALEKQRILQQVLEQTKLLKDTNAQLLREINERTLAENRLKERALELGKLNEKLVLANKYKSEFLANVSHELRTPLNSILVISDLQSENSENNLTVEQLEEIKIINSSGWDLLNLINDILDFSKIEAGKMDVKMDEVIIDIVLADLYWKFGHVAEKKDINFVLGMGEDLPKNLITDKKKLIQILRNLLSNAFKFTSKGSVELRADFPHKNTQYNNKKLQTGNVIAFKVQDTGIGIPVEKQSDIFEAFHQSDGTSTRNYGGTGLGLTISRELTQLLGGEIELQSEQERGTIFTLYLPLKPIGVEVDSKTLESHSNSVDTLSKENIATGINDLSIERNRETKIEFNNKLEPKGRKILLVDDDVRNMIALSKVLKNHGFETSQADNGKLALDKLNTDQEIELILMDIMMPVMNGYDTIRKIRSMKKLKGLPIIAITAKSLGDSRKECIAAGADHFLTKPIDVNMLLLQMSKLLCK